MTKNTASEFSSTGLTQIRVPTEAVFIERYNQCKQNNDAIQGTG
jgi:hypothetical protein